MKFTIRAILLVTGCIAAVFAFGRHLNTVHVKLTNETGRRIEVKISQAGNHSIHGRHSLTIEPGACQSITLNTRFLEASFVTVTDESGKEGRFERPRSEPGLFRRESYAIHGEFLKDASDETVQEAPVTKGF